MADNVAITAGTGTTIAADDIAGVLHQRVKISQGADGAAADVSSAAPLQVTLANTAANTNKLLVTPDLPSGASTAAKQPALGTAGSASTDVITIQGIASGTVVPISVASIPSHAVTNAGTFATQSAVTAASGSFSSGALASGSVASGAFASGALASGSVASGAIASGAIAAGAIAAGATSIADNEDVASADGDRGVKMLVVRKNTAASTSGTDGDYQMPITNTRGALWMAIEDGSGGQVTSFSGPTQYTEDAAAASDPVGSALLAVRRDTLSTSEVSADGDNIALKASSKGKLHVAAELRLGDVVSDTGSGTGGSATQRVIVDSSQLGTLVQGGVPCVSGGYEYEACPISATTTLGATGNTGDYLEGLTCVVGTAATSLVQIKDGSDTAIDVLPSNVGAGIGSYYIPLGLISRTGAWQVITLAGTKVLATGNFT